MSDELIKLLIIYHSAAEAPVQKIFEAFSAFNDIQLKVVGPQFAFRPRAGKTLKITQTKSGKYDLIPGKIFGAKKSAGGPYKTVLFNTIKKFQPAIIHVLSEAFSSVVAQTIFYKNLVSPRSKVFFYAFENMLNTRQLIAKNKLLGCYWNYIQKRVDGGTAANTEAIELLLQMGIPRPRMQKIFWGIPLDNFFPKNASRLKARLDLKDSFVIGYVGLMIAEKGIDLLIRALAALPEKCKLLLVGDGGYLDRLRAQWQDLKLDHRVIHIPHVPNEQLVDYFNCMDLLILPSRQSTAWKEQFGRVIAEAMACGVPVIGSSSGAIPEVIADAGLIFSEGDHRDLTAKIKLLRQDSNLRNSLAEKGLTRCKQEFSCQVFARRHLEFYRARLAHPPDRSKNNA